MTCKLSHKCLISITLQYLLDQCVEFTFHIWWLLLHSSLQTVLVYLKPSEDNVVLTAKTEIPLWNWLKWKQLYPYNPILRWLSPQIIMASLLLIPKLMSACTHLGYRGALFSNVTLIKGANHVQRAVLTGNMRGHLYLNIWTHWIAFRSNVVDSIHKVQSNSGLHNST